MIFKELITFFGISNLQNIKNIFLYLVGFLTPFPIYWSTKLQEVYLFDFDVAIVSIDKTVLGNMVPIGFFTFAIFWTIQTYKVILVNGKFLKSILLILLVYIALGSITIAYKVILSSTIVFLYLFNDIVNYNILTSYVKAYLTGFIVVLVLNFVSFFLVTPDITNIDYMRNILGFEIYSYHVTYSAVCSLMFGFSFCYLAHHLKSSLKVDKYTIIMVMLLLLSFWVLIGTARKAAVLDVIFLTTTLLLIFSSQVITRLRLTVGSLIIFPSLVGAILYTQAVLDKREVTQQQILEQRAEAYIVVIRQFSQNNLQEFLFGFDKGFGGYSNIVLDIVARAGVIGISVYLTLLIYMLQRLVKKIKSGSVNKKNKKLFLSHFSLFFAFTLIVGNTANLNISNPYYLINMISVLVAFNLFTSHAKQ